MIKFDVTPETTPESLKRLYLKFSKVLHPDNGGTENDFKELSKAYRSACYRLQLKQYDNSNVTAEPTANPNNIAKTVIIEGMKSLYKNGGKEVLNQFIEKEKNPLKKMAFKAGLNGLDKIM